MKKGEKKKPEIVHNPFSVLNPKELAELRVLLTHPHFLKLLGIVQKFRPSSNCTHAGSGTRDAFSNERANARLAEMRGWDAYQAALFAALAEKTMKQLVAEATYPDSGRLDHRFGEIPSPDLKKS